MNKAILMSIQPQHAFNILNGKKTLELRKNVPKNYVGWVYIYVTKGKHLLINKDYASEFYEYYKMTEKDREKFLETELLYETLNSKVVARFWFDETYYITQSKNVYGDKLNQISIYDNKNFGWKAPKEEQETLKQLCLTEQQVLDYGKGKDLYAWHIKDLEIFDKPMELSDFYRQLPYPNNVNVSPLICGEESLDDRYLECIKGFEIKRPPQSWQYVYVRESKKMTKNKMIFLKDVYMSSDNMFKKRKVLKLINRLNKKDNDYVATRDIIVLAYSLLLEYTNIENVDTTENGIKELEKLTNGLFDVKEKENEK